MAAKLNTDKYLIQAYQSPYDGKLFAVADKDKFETHLREGQRIHNAKAKMRRAKEKRLEVWASIRRDATCVADIPTLIQARVTPEMLTTYKRLSFLKRGGITFKSTLCGTQKIDNLPVSHTCPIGGTINWAAQDSTKPSSKLGMCIHSAEYPSNVENEASKESGIHYASGAVQLYADDWHFVAVLSIWAVLEGEVLPPPKRVYQKEYNNPSWAAFNEDIERYCDQHLGLSLTAVKELHANGLLSQMTIELMARNHSKTQPLLELESAPLPAGLLDEGFEQHRIY